MRMFSMAVPALKGPVSGKFGIAARQIAPVTRIFVNNHGGMPVALSSTGGAACNRKKK